MIMPAPPPDPDVIPPQPYAYLQPQAGTLLVWESWLRHEVPVNAAKSDRISLSFNYAWR